jgi:hypothetical protein
LAEIFSRNIESVVVWVPLLNPQLGGCAFIKAVTLPKANSNQSEFHGVVYECVPVPPERNFNGEIIDGLMGVQRAIRVCSQKI